MILLNVSSKTVKYVDGLKTDGLQCICPEKLVSKFYYRIFTTIAISA